jgi:hypothetical protein
MIFLLNKMFWIKVENNNFETIFELEVEFSALFYSLEFEFKIPFESVGLGALKSGIFGHF